MPNRWIAVAGLAGFLGVATGAFGAHGLKDAVSPDLLAIFKTGSHYCQVHAVALLVIGLLADRHPSALINRCLVYEHRHAYLFRHPMASGAHQYEMVGSNYPDRRGMFAHWLASFAVAGLERTSERDRKSLKKSHLIGQYRIKGEHFFKP